MGGSIIEYENYKRYNEQLAKSRDEGFMEGVKQGKNEGFIEGKDEGIKQGVNKLLDVLVEMEKLTRAEADEIFERHSRLD